MFEWDEESLVKVFSSCIKDNMEDYLCGHWYTLLPLSSVDIDSNLDVTIKLWVDELAINVMSKVGKVKEYSILDGEEFDIKFNHMNDTILYLHPLQSTWSVEDKYPYEGSIKIEDRHLKSMVVKYLREQTLYYFNTVIYERQHPMYNIYDGDDIIGHRG